MILLNKKILPLIKINYHNKYYYKYADRRDIDIFGLDESNIDIKNNKNDSLRAN